MRHWTPVMLLLCNPLLAQVAPAQALASVTATGYLTDTMCGAKGATSKHIDCPKRQFASGKAQYAIYDEASRRLYILDLGTQAGGSEAGKMPAVQLLIEQHLGQRVRITGTISSTPITRAGQSLVPDTEAAPSSAENAGGINPAPTTTSAAASNPPMRVVTRAKAQDTSTPVAGVLTIASIEAVPR